jgi:hypothetical protein
VRLNVRLWENWDLASRRRQCPLSGPSRDCTASRSLRRRPILLVLTAHHDLERGIQHRPLQRPSPLPLGDFRDRGPLVPYRSLPVRAIHHFPAEPLVEAHSMCSVKVNSRKFSLSRLVFYRSDQRGIYRLSPDTLGTTNKPASHGDTSWSGSISDTTRRHVPTGSPSAFATSATPWL